MKTCLLNLWFRCWNYALAGCAQIMWIQLIPVAVGFSQEVPHVSQVKLHILLAFIVLEEV